MNRITFVIIALLVFAAGVSQSIASADPKLRYDGFYRCEYAVGGKNLRFYPDGTVVEEKFTAQPERMWKSLTKENGSAHVGKVKVEGDNLSFTTSWKKIYYTDYSGKIVNGDQLHLDWQDSRRSWHRGTDTFVFVEISDSPAKEAVGNPYEIALNSKLLNLAGSGNPSEIASIIDKGANIESKNSEGETALIIAAKNGKADNVKFILKKGADINAVNDFKLTALMAATVRDYSDVVDVLLASGADINKRASNGFTAVMMAAAQGNLTCLSLIKNGADVDIKGNDGIITALELARINLEKYKDPLQYVTRNRYSLIIKWIEQASKAPKKQN